MRTKWKIIKCKGNDLTKQPKTFLKKSKTSGKITKQIIIIIIFFF